MDNLTHSLVGAFVAVGALEFAPVRWRPEFRRSSLVASVLGNNLPDLDFLYSGITSGKLGYLLHHRGHTHTVVCAVGLALLQSAVFAAIWAKAARRQSSPGHVNWQRELGWVIGLSLGGVLIHLGLDFTNNYGVHPWWPWNNRWYYGDSVFIIEPLLWVTLSIVLLWRVNSGWSRGALGMMGALGMIFPWVVPLPRVSALGVGLVAALFLCVCFLIRHRPKSGLAVGVLGIAALYTTQLLARSRITSQVHEAVSSSSHVVLHDLVRTPLPATVWCWNLLAVTTEGEDYVVRLGRATPWPGWLRVRDCPQTRGDASAPLEPGRNETRSGIVWDSEYRIALTSLREQARDCWFSAFLRFARAPYLDGTRVGDLRYDRDTSEGFAEFTLPEDGSCPRWVPPWDPPRRELF